MHPIEMVDISLYINSLNQSLWETMNEKFNIKVEFGKENCYGNYLKGNDCTIYVCENEAPKPAAFTHELLHLYLPSKNIRIGCAIEGLFKERYPHCLIFDKDLYDHISNCLEHRKMFPLFLQMGFPAEFFLQDYNDIKLTIAELTQIKQQYKSGIFKKQYHSQTINWFIGKFFAAKADVNPKNKYDKILIEMQKIDNQLYAILYKFWQNWLTYDIELQREVWEFDYHKIVEDLRDDITEWAKHKNIQY